MAEKPELLTDEEFHKITELARRLEGLKAMEAKAVAERQATEAEIATLIPGKEDGQRTVNLSERGSITVKRGLSYTADFDELEKLAIWKETGIAPPIAKSSARSVDVPAYKWWRENQREAFIEIAKHITVKPKKTSVTVKRSK